MRTLVGAMYCLAAINGAPLGQLEAFPPPDPYPYKNRTAIAVAGAIPWIRSYDEALAKAKATGTAGRGTFWCTTAALPTRSSKDVLRPAALRVSRTN